MNIDDAFAAAPSATAGPAPAAADEAYRAKAQEAAQKFESFFIAEIMKQMRRSTRELSGDEGMFRDRVNDDMLSMADTLVADALSGRRAFGVADAILAQLLPRALNVSPPAVAQEKKTPDEPAP